MVYPMEKRRALYKIMDALKGKKTAVEVRNYAVSAAIIMEEELPLKMLLNLSSEYRAIFPPPKRWVNVFCDIQAIVNSCLKYY